MKSGQYLVIIKQADGNWSGHLFEDEMTRFVREVDIPTNLVTGGNPENLKQFVEEEAAKHGLSVLKEHWSPHVFVLK